MAALTLSAPSALGEKLAVQRVQLDLWTDKQASIAEATAAAHGEQAAQAAKSLGELTAARAALGATHATESAASGAHLAAVSREDARTAALRQESAELPAALQRLRAEQAAQSAALAAKAASTEQAAGLKASQLNELTRGVAAYRQLGLDFERAGDDQLRLIFSQIDAADPSREFWFGVSVDDGDRYQVQGCHPTLPDAVVDPMLAELNSTNNFTGFVYAMRRAFKATTVA